MPKVNVTDSIDFSDLNLAGIDMLDIDIMSVSESSAIPEGAASTGTWSCGGHASCSCSYQLPSPDEG